MVLVHQVRAAERQQLRDTLGCLRQRGLIVDVKLAHGEQRVDHVGAQCLVDKNVNVVARRDRFGMGQRRDFLWIDVHECFLGARGQPICPAP